MMTTAGMTSKSSRKTDPASPKNRAWDQPMAENQKKGILRKEKNHIVDERLVIQVLKNHLGP